MTLKNKYQEINEHIRLEETQKDDIVNALMAYDVKPKRTYWKYIGVFAVIVLVGYLLYHSIFKEKEMHQVLPQQRMRWKVLQKILW